MSLIDMSMLLNDSVWSMESSTAKRGVYPMHGYKLGIYRIPIQLDDENEIQSIYNVLKNTFGMDRYADRVYMKYEWNEENGKEDESEYEKATLSVTVEIVTGECVDMIYQVYPNEKYLWVKDYRKKADHFAKMMIDTALRNTILYEKMLSMIQKTKYIDENESVKIMESITPLAKIIPGAIQTEQKQTENEKHVENTEQKEFYNSDGIKHGPIDIEFKSHLPVSTPYSAGDHTIKTWGRKGEDNKTMGVWGEFVSVDFDICVADGACIDACPVNVYEWFDTPGNSASKKKPLMSREPDCIFCLACEGVCPPQAIKIFEPK